MQTITVFSTQPYDSESLTHWGCGQYNWHFVSQKLDTLTAAQATGSAAICVFVNDDLSAPVLDTLAALGIKTIVLRCAGYNNVDIAHAKQLGFQLARVPAYSPEAVAEHCIAMILCLNRKLHKAYNRVRDDNFSLDGLMGFNLHGKTVGIIGTGRIGLTTAKILAGFGCNVLCVDPQPQATLPSAQCRYVELNELYQQADIISLHCPLTPDTFHMINPQSLALMKPGVMLINTSRGGLIDTKAVIEGLKSKLIGFLGLDVYEQEADLFFKDLSDHVIADEVFQRLLTFPNVLITGHQAFFTAEALAQIGQITCANLQALLHNQPCANSL